MNFITLFPDVYPSAPYGNGTPLVNPGMGASGIRMFRYTFRTPTSWLASHASFFFSQSSSDTLDHLIAIYKTSAPSNNLINSTNITNLASGFSVRDTSVLFGSITTNTLGVEGFRINNLELDTEYSIITRTSFNDIGTDSKLVAVVVDGIQAPLTYVETKSGINEADAFYNGQYINLTQFAPLTYPNGTPLNPPDSVATGTRFFEFSFTTPPSGIIKVFGATNGTSYTITGLVDPLNPGPSLFTADYIKNYSIGSYSAPPFTPATGPPYRWFNIEGLTPNKIYRIICRATTNGVTNNPKLRVALFNSSDQLIPLTYVNTGHMLLNGIFMEGTSMFPDVEPAAPYGDGTALADYGTVTGSRFFKFTFRTPPSVTSVNIFNTTGSSVTTCTIIGIFKSDIMTVALSSTTGIVGTTINNALVASQSAVQRYGFTGLTGNTEYTIITRTTSNITSLEAIFVAASGATNIPITYVETGLTLRSVAYSSITPLNFDIIKTTNLAPNFAPNGQPLSEPALNILGNRYYKFTFTPTQASINFRAITGNNSLNLSYFKILGIYKSNTTNNLVSTVSNKAIGVSSSESGITFPINLTGTGTAFTLSGLTANDEYYIISNTLLNPGSASSSLQVALFTENNTAPLTYTQTGNTAFSDGVISNVTYSWTKATSTSRPPPPYNTGGLLAAGDPNYYKFIFTATKTSYKLVLNAPSSMSLTTRIDGIYRSGDTTFTNLINSSISSVESGITKGDNILTIQTNTLRSAQLDGLTIGQEYYFIIYTGSTPSLPAGELLMTLQKNDLSAEILNYVQVGGIYLNNTIISLEYTNVLPNTNPPPPYGDSAIRTNANAMRFTKFNFVASNSSYNVYLKSSTSYYVEIFGIYKVSDNTSIINTTNITNIQTNVILNPINNIYVTTTVNGLGFTLNNLVVGESYYIISLCRQQSIVSDLSIGLFNTTSLTFETLTYTDVGSIFRNYTLLNQDYTNLVPNVMPDSSTFPAQPPNIFFHSFVAPSTTCNFDFISNGFSGSEEAIRYIGEEFMVNNIVDNKINTSITNVYPGITVSSNSIAVASNFFAKDDKSFTLNDLTPGKKYIIIIRTSYNDAGNIDIGLIITNTLDNTYVPINYYNAIYNVSASSVSLNTLLESHMSINTTSSTSNTMSDTISNAIIQWPQTITSQGAPLGYNIYYRLYNNPTYTKSNTNLITSLTHTIPGLLRNSIYIIKLAAVYNNGNETIEISARAIANVRSDGVIEYGQDSYSSSTIIINNITTTPNITYSAAVQYLISNLSMPFFLKQGQVSYFVPGNSNQYIYLYDKSFNNGAIFYYYTPTNSSLYFRPETGSTTSYICYDGSDSNGVSNAIGNLRINIESIVDPIGRTNWYNLVPNVDKNGNSIVATEGAKLQERYFRHSFNSGANTELNLFFKTNNTSSTEERVLGIYKSGSRNNLLKQGLGIFNIISGLTYMPNSYGTIVLADNQLDNNSPTIPNAKLTTEANTTYYMIVKTKYNNNDTEDIQIAIENNAGINTAITYESTKLEDYNVYEASGAPMIVIGRNISQKYKINSNDARIAALEADIATKVTMAHNTTKVGELQTAINNRVTQAAYDAKIPIIEGRITAVSGRQIGTTKIDGRFSEILDKLIDVENQVDNGGSGSGSGSGSQTIDELIATKQRKIAYDDAVKLLTDEDGRLMTEIAKMVVAETQLTVDGLQNTDIDKKLDATVYNPKMTAIDTKNNTQDGLIANLTEPNTYYAKIDAVEEYINMFLSDNEIILPDGSTYEYNGTYQGLI